MSWSIDKSSELYGIDYWGQPHFFVNKKGRVSLRATEESKEKGIDLYDLMEDLCERGIRPPILLRFSNIIQHRVDLINGCFAKAIEDYEYKGEYRGVYPIKVNQQKHLLSEIIKYGRPHKLGMECGSKPELLVALALMDTPEAYIICNGFKDEEYIETALLSRKLGRDTIIVVDRYEELELIITASKKLGIPPKIGFRAKLWSKGAGRWMESSGEHSKFGLTPSEIVCGIDRLKKDEMLDSLVLLHAHVGSQIPSILSIKNSIKELARVFTELHALGAKPHLVDVGGGLGVDYDGSGKGDGSTNYSEQEYANDVVSIIQSICDEREIPHPHIISESGRALIAHSTVLAFDVLGKNDRQRPAPFFLPETEDSQPVKDLYEMYEMVSEENLNEYYNDLVEKRMEVEQLFSFGALSLKQRAKAEDLYGAVATKMAKIAKKSEESEDIYWTLQEQLSDTHFCNFSIFQSLPDSWAVDQVFPMMPLQRLDEQPERRAILVDLTCDSDGQINKFIDTESGETQTYLEVHKLSDNRPYYIGVFLTGAYQETLGDLHNLFGDTDAVHISLTDDGYTVDHVVEGDTVAEVLEYVEFRRSDLVDQIRQTSERSIKRGDLSKKEARLLMRHYEDGLSGYTYLEQPES